MFKVNDLVHLKGYPQFKGEVLAVLNDDNYKVLWDDKKYPFPVIAGELLVNREAKFLPDEPQLIPPKPCNHLQKTSTSYSGSPAGKLPYSSSTQEITLKDGETASPVAPLKAFYQPPTQEVTTMSAPAASGCNVKRRTVTLTLIDDDTSLDVSEAVVGTYPNIIVEDDIATVINQICLDGEVAKAIANHNVKRSKAIDLHILKNTGKEVGLQPVKLKDLRWEVK